MAQGKRKGDTYERDIAKYLSNKFDDSFRRTPLSGAFTGGLNRFRKDVQTLREDAQEVLSGDIIVPDWFPFSVECKHYKDTPNLYTLLKEKPEKKVKTKEGVKVVPAHYGDQDLDEWFDKAQRDAEFTKKDFLLMFKITGKAEFVGVSKERYDSIVGDIKSSIYIVYKNNYIFDKETFINNGVVHYFPEEYKKKFL